MEGLILFPRDVATVVRFVFSDKLEKVTVFLDPEFFSVNNSIQDDISQFLKAMGINHNIKILRDDISSFNEIIKHIRNNMYIDVSDTSKQLLFLLVLWLKENNINVKIKIGDLLIRSNFQYKINPADAVILKLYYAFPHISEKIIYTYVGQKENNRINKLKNQGMLDYDQKIIDLILHPPAVSTQKHSFSIDVLYDDYTNIEKFLRILRDKFNISHIFPIFHNLQQKVITVFEANPPQTIFFCIIKRNYKYFLSSKDKEHDITDIMKTFAKKLKKKAPEREVYELFKRWFNLTSILQSIIAKRMKTKKRRVHVYYDIKKIDDKKIVCEGLFSLYPHQKMFPFTVKLNLQ